MRKEGLYSGVRRALKLSLEPPLASLLLLVFVVLFLRVTDVFLRVLALEMILFCVLSSGSTCFCSCKER